jgi:hypothetical protein
VNAHPAGSQGTETASENTNPIERRRPGALPTALTGGHQEILDAYTTALATAPLSVETRRTYASKVGQYLASDLDDVRISARKAVCACTARARRSATCDPPAVAHRLAALA